MQSSEDASHHLSLGKTLQELLKADDENGISISEVARAVGEKGFGLLLIVLSLPSALPVPAPAYSTPFGLVMALIALQIPHGCRGIVSEEAITREISVYTFLILQTALAERSKSRRNCYN